MRREFEAVIETDERGRVFVTIPFSPTEAWGKRSRHFVEGTLDGAPVKTSLGSRGGAFFLLVTKALQESADVAPGKKVKISLAPTDAHESDLPEDFEKALGAAPSARKFFETLSPFYRNAYVSHVTSAKRDETRARRVAEVVDLLKAGKKQR